MPCSPMNYTHTIRQSDEDIRHVEVRLQFEMEPDFHLLDIDARCKTDDSCHFKWN